MLKIQRGLVLLLMIFLGITQTSCDNDEDSNSDCEAVVCTAILVRVMVSVTDEDLNPVALDSFQVIDLENEKDISISLASSEFVGLQELGQYPLIEDGIIGLNEERNLKFIGFLDNQEVINRNYTVKTDCCHVSLVAGNKEITL